MNASSPNPLAEDLNHILIQTRHLWEEIRDQKIFITGGTGFFGCWLLESFAWVNADLHLNAEALVLTRNYETFLKKVPHLASNPAIKFHIGDVRDFDFPQGQFPFVIHAATEASTNLNEENPLLMWDTIVEGTRHTLEFARQTETKKFLLVSSGAVYGKQPPEMDRIPEEYTGAPDPVDVKSAYGEGKRAAELLCAIYAKKYTIQAKIARCFAFVGPYLPLDAHFAMGNFIRDGLQGGPIEVKGDGSPCRSYLYAADLAIWLWTILFRGLSGRPYNVGSEAGLSIGVLAKNVAQSFPTAPNVRIAGEANCEKPPGRYVPSTRRARHEMGLSQQVKLNEAIDKTKHWNQPSLTTQKNQYKQTGQARGIPKWLK